MHPPERFILGVFLSIAGAAIILLHRKILEHLDWWHSRDWPIGLGTAWTGKYSRGGLIFTYAVIILVGAVFLFIGVIQIFHAFSSS